MARVFPQTIKNGLDEEAVEGGVGMPYAIANVHVDYHMPDTGIPVGFWRSVNNTFNAFAVESFIDELAHAAKKDPYEYRRDLLGKAPRHLGVLNLAASKAGWSTPLPAGRSRGIAVWKSFDTYVAEVAEISMGPDGTPRVHRVVCAVDCGPVVNPSIVEAQMESAIVYGLTAALWGEITIDKGRAQQSNFHQYLMLRMGDMPRVEVHIVPSTDAQGGVGEPGTPPIAPAVCNAIFAATGKRVRKLPIGKIACTQVRGAQCAVVADGWLTSVYDRPAREQPRTAYRAPLCLGRPHELHPLPPRLRRDQRGTRHRVPSAVPLAAGRLRRHDVLPQRLAAHRLRRDRHTHRRQVRNGPGLADRPRDDPRGRAGRRLVHGAPRARTGKPGRVVAPHVHRRQHGDPHVVGAVA